MKKLVSLVMVLGIMLSSLTAFAENEVKILKDGEEVISDVAPYVTEDGVAMLPMRAIFESIGAIVSWEQETRTAISAYNVNEEAKALFLQIGTNYAFLNGEKIEFDKEALIVGDRTFIPFAAYEKTLGYAISWDADTYTVTITTK